ncbi:DUF418 domain-containing protein [Pseudoalteromonas sp.]|uniref:DUF418 domain-containing protein n=1 Tax=Pseudoalteromonas sp. TaxID=53249 RepID=UPI001BCEEAC2|nr:DUF418 domain-containing protein [Pseudoalteromonas sp.]
MDFIRGIAVLGLVFINCFSFAIFELNYTPLTTPPPSDQFLNLLSLIFVEGRFRTLFTLLFGAGLYIQYQQYQYIEPLKKRLHWLIVFGLIHGFLLWAGDILFLYGVSALLVLRYLSYTNEELKNKAAFYIFIYLIATAMFMLGLNGEPLNRDSPEFFEIYNTYYQSISAHFSQNIAMSAYMLMAVPTLLLWASAGFMLIGIVVYKYGVFSKGVTRAALIKLVVLSVFLTSIRLILEPYNQGIGYALQEPVNELAALCVALLYIHLMVKLCNNSAHIGLLIQQVGRLAFTLYISQTIMQLLLFKVLFPQWALNFNRLDYWLLAISLVIVQLIFTAVYCRYFKQGPLEYLWRKLAKINREKIA